MNEKQKPAVWAVEAVVDLYGRVLVLFMGAGGSIRLALGPEQARALAQGLLSAADRARVYKPQGATGENEN
jgi:hypothetical protein